MDFAHAVAIAARAYGADRDEAGRFVLAQPLDVAAALGPTASPTELSTAVLYRIPVDTKWRVEHLAAIDTEPVVCEAVDALMKRPGESYMAYVRRVCAAPGRAGDAARSVLAAELRLGIVQTDSDALRERYESSLPLIQEALATVD